MKTKSNLPPLRILTDHQLAVNFIRDFRPQWLDELPMLARNRAPGKFTAARGEHYDTTTRTGAFVTFTESAIASQRGWFVAYRVGCSEPQFNEMVNLICASQFLSGCRPLG
jgi:hypothetical protein